MRLRSVVLMGSAFAVGCDPVNNPAGFGIGITVAVIAITVVSIVPFIFILKRVFQGQAADARLKAQGEPAMAQILTASPTGLRINDNPEVSFALFVQRQGQAPYQAQAKAIVNQFSIARVQQGMTVPIRVDPADPQKIALDLDRPVAPAMGAVPGAMPQQAGMMPQQAGMMPQQQAMMAQQQAGMTPQQQQAMAQQQAMMAQQQAMAAQQQAMAQAGLTPCPSCHQPVPPGVPACPSCGAPLQPPQG